MKLSYHFNFKVSDSNFLLIRKGLRSSLETIQEIPLARIEVSKDETYIETYNIVVFLLEKKCISSIKGTSESMQGALEIVNSKIVTYNSNQNLVKAFLRKTHAA